MSWTKLLFPLQAAGTRASLRGNGFIDQMQSERLDLAVYRIILEFQSINITTMFCSKTAASV
jgi:hypothetical protein